MTVTLLRPTGVCPSDFLEADQIASLEQLIREDKYREPTNWREIGHIAGIIAVGGAAIFVMLALCTGGF